MNTKQAFEWTKGRESRGHARSDWIGSRGYSVVSKFPGTRTRPGTGDTRSIREVGGLLQRHDHRPWSSPAWRPSFSHVCEDYYVHVCPFKPTLRACSAGRSRIYRFQRRSERGNDVTRRNCSMGDTLELDPFSTSSLGYFIGERMVLFFVM